MKLLMLILSSSIFSFPLETKTEYIQPEMIKHYTGLINNKYKIFMHLTTTGNKIKGKYRYATQKTWLTVEGTLTAPTGEIHLVEGDGAKITGRFDGNAKDSVITGTWSNAAKTKQLPFEVNTDHKDVVAKFEVTFSVDGDWISLNKINHHKANGEVEELKLDQDPEAPRIHGTRPELTFEDFNFDGYSDLITLAEVGGVNATYYFWLFDPSSGEFVYNAALHGMSNPEVDIQNKQIKTFSRNSATSYTYTNYNYVDDGYKEVYKEEKEY
jgi:hypothetical protein